MKRRLFLRGAGGAALAAPFLGSLERSARAQATDTPKRTVIFYTNNGCIVPSWYEGVAENGPLVGASLAGTTLNDLEPFASKLLFPKGLAMFPRGFNEEVEFDPHDQGMGSKLTCASLSEATGERSAGARSWDHVAAEMVNKGTSSPLVISIGGNFGGIKADLSYSSAGSAYGGESNPGNVFDGLTGLLGAGTGDTEQDHLVAKGKSIIDLVKGDLDTFKRLNMSGADHKKIDDWLSLLRETEQQVIPAACNGDAAISLGITSEALSAAGGGGGFGGGSEKAFKEGGDMFIKLIALTMMCDANRSIILQWPGFVSFTWDGLDTGYDHHGLSHRNGSAAVGGEEIPGVEDMIRDIDRWYAGRYAKLVAQIDAIVEGDGTMLDNSAVMWLPELSDGNAHNNDNLPIAIAGSLGGYLKQGMSVDLAPDSGGGNNFGGGFGNGGVPINKLYATLLNGMGAASTGVVPPEVTIVDGKVDSFGTTDNNDTGTILDPGELIDIIA